MAIRAWLVVQPLDRARTMVEGGYIQAPWGVPEPVQAMGEADGVVIYSPRESNPDGEPLRSVVAAGRVLPGEAYQAGDRGSSPWRRDVEWMPEARIAPIRPLRDLLDLTRRNRYWGELLRPGWLELSRRDFEVLEDAVRRRPPEPGVLGVTLRERAQDAPPLLRETGWPPPSPVDPELF
ncbi:hypothetical protein USB125703_00474 [Pseudoclavibacter triregionum]|nr:hypothetical protein USB125703_00474 [Pseudoclavibacter triregionum]